LINGSRQWLPLRSHRGLAEHREVPLAGSIVRRGTACRVLMYAGRDPLPGERVYLDEPTTELDEPQRTTNPTCRGD
jgi:hypothetical protein